MSAVQGRWYKLFSTSTAAGPILGFLLGQLSIALLIGAFIKFFIFGDLPSHEARGSERAAARRRRTLLSTRSPSETQLRKKRSTILRPPGVLTTRTILAKTYYNVASHQPESLDWFNVLVAQTIAQFRADAQSDEALLRSLTLALNGTQRPAFVDEIVVTEVALGDDFPIFSNCRVIAVAPEEGEVPETGRLQARMDVDLSDCVTLGVETQLLLNYPKPRVAVLPIALAVSVVRFSGTLSISFIPPSPSAAGSPHAATPTTLAFSFLDDYRLELSVRSLVGSRSRLQDVPKIAQLVEARLHDWFDERAVEPRFQQVVLPSLWPRMRTARGGEEGGEEGEGIRRRRARAASKVESGGDRMTLGSVRGSMPGSMPI
ncbi:MAG: ERMES complex subunit mmm1 [Trizodia sp. TS-e1964]|nr:MAG: ERMES complex subunit mmm1 [Trizodia sp. TS-e1964]